MNFKMNLKYVIFFVIYISYSYAYNAAKMCDDNSFIMAGFKKGESVYDISMFGHIYTTNVIEITLDAVGVVEPKFCVIGNLIDPSIAVLLESDVINNIFRFKLLKNSSYCSFNVRSRFGPAQPPYLISFKIDGEEKCSKPNRTIFSYYTNVGTGIEKPWSGAPDKFCGRRRKDTQYRSLITNGFTTASGKWPWHAALFRGETGNTSYICGGTLVSKSFVLTAAHCVTKRNEAVNPKLLKIIVGKFELQGTEETTQNKDVFKIIVHEEFNHRKLNNDIALLQLNSEVSFNNYVQPACVWFEGIYDQLDSYEIVGTVVGWGMDERDVLTEELHETTMPQVAELTCIRYDPIFYTTMLNGNKFCAGYANGTAACNGDSGGGFLVFVPDVKTPSFNYTLKDRPGAWYIKGIVSVALVRNDERICDPKAYPVFTDVSKYKEWILTNIS